MKTKKGRIILIIVSIFVLIAIFFSYQIHSFKKAKLKAINTYTILATHLKMEIYDNDNFVNYYGYVDYNDNVEKVPVDFKLFSKYLVKRITFKKLDISDFIPNWKLVSGKSLGLTSEQILENVNNNILYNPKYIDAKKEVGITKAIRFEDVNKKPEETANILFNIALSVTNFDELMYTEYSPEK